MAHPPSSCLADPCFLGVRRCGIPWLPWVAGGYNRSPTVTTLMMNRWAVDSEESLLAFFGPPLYTGGSTQERAELMQERQPTTPLFPPVNVTTTTTATPGVERVESDHIRLLRDILAAQDRQNELMEELVSQLGARPAAAQSGAGAVESRQSGIGSELPQRCRIAQPRANRLSANADRRSERQCRRPGRRRIPAQRIRRSLRPPLGAPQRRVAGAGPVKRPGRNLS